MIRRTIMEKFNIIKECFLNSPPKPHGFVTSPLQSFILPPLAVSCKNKGVLDPLGQMLENIINNNDYLSTIGLIGVGIGVIIVFAYTSEGRSLHPLDSAQLSPTEAQNLIGQAGDAVDDMEEMLNLLNSSVSDLIRNTVDDSDPVLTQEISDIIQRIKVLGNQASSYLDSTAPIIHSLSRQAYLSFQDTCSRLDDCQAFLDGFINFFN